MARNTTARRIVRSAPNGLCIILCRASCRI